MSFDEFCETWGTALAESFKKAADLFLAFFLA